LSVLVQKYGGSSVATPDRLLGVARRVVASKERGLLPVVVVSAMGKTTDELLALARSVSPEPHRRELDLVVSAGERISMALLAMAIRDLGHEAISLTGSQAGIITTTDHQQARIIEVRPVRVFEALEAGRIVIVGGFAGVSVAKEVTTLGRGGSDTTAIALAAALGADCEICSDVDGVYTADPRVVPEAHPLPQLAHAEILELGLRGAKVLAPQAIDYAQRHGVTLHARSTFADGRGTVVTTRPHPGTGRAVGVATDAKALFVAANADAADALWAALDAEAAPVRDVVRGPNGLQAIVDTTNHRGLAERLAARDGVTVRPELGTASAVGEGIAEQRAVWAKLEAALAGLGVVPERMWGTAVSVNALVPKDRLDAVATAWHAALPGLSEAD
jgi:aspartate kinase